MGGVQRWSRLVADQNLTVARGDVSLGGFGGRLVMLRLLAACLSLVVAQPAFADQLTAAQVYQAFQGDWVSVSRGSADEPNCDSSVRRLMLDVDGLGLTIQDIRADGTVGQELRYRLLAIPRADDKATFLEFLGPEVDRSLRDFKWRERYSISMSSPDRMLQYHGLKDWDVPRSDGLDDIVPHGAGGYMARCR